MKERNPEKEITNNELLRYITEQFDRVFIILDSKADKSDLENLRIELKGDIAELRSEVKYDLMGLKDELKGDIQSLRKDTNQRFFALKNV